MFEKQVITISMLAQKPETLWAPTKGQASYLAFLLTPWIPCFVCTQS